jgi:arylsulfatase A
MGKALTLGLILRQRCSVNTCFWIAALGLPLITTAMAESQPLDQQRPNIILIMADDLGFGDLSVQGAKGVNTPAMDALAASGLRFTNAHSSASTCTPTRFSLLTGKMAWRQKGTGVAPPNGGMLIAPGSTTLPSLLKRGGYATAVIGKWHLGLGQPAPDWNGELKPGPLEIGFDHAYLLPTTNDRVPQVIVRDHRVEGLDRADPLWVSDKAPAGNQQPTGLSHRHLLKMDWSHGHNQTIHNGVSRIGFYGGAKAARFRDEDLADRWMERAEQWMAEQTNPFFLFFASHDLHVPRLPHERFKGASQLGPRGDSIVQLDWCVQRLVQWLRKRDQLKRTLVILCSDNGPVLDDGYRDQAVEKNADHRPSGPYSAGKYSVHEGGTRTPFIASWPGRIKPGVSHQLICTMDLPATLAALAGVPLRSNDCPDSHNLLAALLGEPQARGREHLLTQDNNGNHFGLRVGPWKLIRQKNALKTQAVTSPVGTTPITGQWGLFNLDQDPGERHNLADSHANKLAELQAKLQELLASTSTRP